MTLLTVHPEDKPNEASVFRDPFDIAEKLWDIGVLFERWESDHVFSSDADSKTVITAYQEAVDRLTDRYEFHTVDVVSIHPDHPEKETLRNTFLSEHTHDDFEARFFVEGEGIFYLHEKNQVFIILCQGGDLISVPSHTKHWFDMGEHPHFKCIRFFTTPEGWVATFTGDPIAKRFPSFEEYLARYSFVS